MKQAKLLIPLMVILIFPLACHRDLTQNYPSERENVFFVDSIKIDNPIIFFYNRTPYICNEGQIDISSLTPKKAKRIAQSNDSYILGDEIYIEIPGYFLFDTIRNKQTNKLEVINKPINDGRYCKFMERKESKGGIYYLKYIENPRYFYLYLMNTAYYDSIFCERYFDNPPRNVLDFKYPSNAYVKVVYPVCPECTK